MKSFAMLMFMEALVLVGTARSVWKRRRSVSEIAFTALVLAQVIWLVAYGLELENPDLAATVLWAKIGYVGIVSVPICFNVNACT